MKETGPVSRIEAWKQVMSPTNMESTSSSFGGQGAYSSYYDGASSQPNGSSYMTPQRIDLSTPVATATDPFLVGGSHPPTTGKIKTTSPHPQQLSRLAAWRETLSPNPTRPAADISEDTL
jgi:hypothetical protein